VVHANAALTPAHRLRVARLIVEEKWPVARAAEHFNVSWPTAKRWATRLVVEGTAGMQDRSSRPHRSPNRTPLRRERRIIVARLHRRLGPVQLSTLLGVPASTVHAVLVRYRLHRLSHVDRRTGQPARRYEHPYPGSLIHVDVKKLGNIPDGGGWRSVGRPQGNRNRQAMRDIKPRGAHRNPRMGHAFVHTVIDDHSRVAYAEIHDDETAQTAVAVLRRALAWYAELGVTVERVLSDNGSAYRSHAWHDACRDLGISPKKTRPYRPQTNGKIERFHRTMGEEWALGPVYHSEDERRTALPAWLDHYNRIRLHTAIGKRPPLSRLTNVPG
jgi:transposase InsO family protein